MICFMVLLVCLSTVRSQTPVISITSTYPNGYSFSFDLKASADKTVIQVDFGDGKLINDTIGTAWTFVYGNKINQTVKIYGSGITGFLCEGRNITSLDISNCQTLIDLDCNQNDLTILDLSKNLALKTLYCYGNQLTTLNLLNNSALTSLYCLQNQLSTLNVSNNIALTLLNCGWNSFTTLDISKNIILTSLSCDYENLTTLDISKNTALISLYCGHNKFPSVDISKNIALNTFKCDFNLLTTLNVSQNTKLLNLQCNNCLLTNLDISKNTALTNFGCSNNNLSSLDLSKDTAIEIINCNNNKLQALDVSKFKNAYHISQINCSNNLISSLILINGWKYYLDCSNNALTFASLPIPTSDIIYAPQTPITIDKVTGTGYEMDLSNQLIINGNTTIYNWKTKGGILLVQGTDYNITNGITKFLRPQTDSVYCALANATFPYDGSTEPWNLVTTCTKVSVYPPPIMTSFYPTTGSTGTIVTITGKYFTGTTAVNFGNKPAASFTVNSATSITATIADGASGSVVVNNGGGTAALSGFTYKLNQNITFGTLGSQTYGNADFTAGATSSSSLAIIYTSSNASVASIVSGKIHITGAGVCTIYANQAGDITNNAAPQVSQNLTINPRPLTLTVNPEQSKIAGNPDPKFTFTITIGSLVKGDSLTGALTRVSVEKVGIYPIQLGTLTAGNNYNITFIPDNFTIVLDTGISNISLNKPGIYPNPTNGLITVDTPEGIVSITDIEGKMLLQCSLDASKTIDISNYTPDMYILLLKTEHFIYEYKVIKK